MRQTRVETSLTIETSLITYQDVNSTYVLTYFIVIALHCELYELLKLLKSLLACLFVQMHLGIYPVSNATYSFSSPLEIRI